jgi:hypothetical protein
VKSANAWGVGWMQNNGSFWVGFSQVESRTVVPLTLKLAKQKVKVLEGCHFTSNILKHLPTHRKKPQLATTFWGDAIVIFTQANFYDVYGG